MKQNSSILGGAILLTAANLLLRLISIVFNVFLTDRIGASGLGLLQLISTIGIFAAIIGTSGVRVAAMYLAAEEFGHRRLGGVRTAISLCLRSGLVISGLAGIALFFLADFFAGHWLGDMRAVPSLRIMGLLLPFSCLCGVMTGYFTACARIRQLVVIEIIERLLGMAITMLLLIFWAKEDLSRACWAITFGSSAGAVFDFIFLYLLYRRSMRNVPTEKQALHMGKRLRKLCIPLALNDYLRAGLNTAEQLLIPYGLTKFGGSTVQALASYGTIHAMVFPVLMFPAAILFSISDLLVPALSRSRAMGLQIRIVDLTDKCIRMGLLFASAVAGFLFVNADALGQLIYRNSQAGEYLRIFAPMVFLLYADIVVDGMLKGLAEQVSCVRYNTITSLLDVVLLYILLPRWGVKGYIFSFSLTHAINLFLSMRRLLVVTGHRVCATDFLRPFLCLVLAVALIELLTLGSASLLVSTLLRGGFFLLFLLTGFVCSGAFASRDYRWLRRVFRRSLPRRIDT